MMIYKSSVTAVENQQGVLGDSDSDNLVREQYKRQALDAAIEFAYALKLAEELDIEITRDQILEAEKEHRTVDGVERSEEGFAKIIKNNFGLSIGDYERLLLLSLTKREVSAAIDERALALTGEIENMLVGNGGDFAKVAEALAGRVIYEQTGDFVDATNLDGGRAVVANGLEVGQWSGKFLSKNGDGWYFVKLIAKTEGQVKHESLRVPFGEFGERMLALKDEEKIKEYIRLDRSVEESE